MIRGRFLSAKERTALQAVMRHPREIHGVARRANAILLLDDGWNCAKVAEALYLDDDRVRTWFKRYQAGGLDEMKVFDWGIIYESAKNRNQTNLSTVRVLYNLNLLECREYTNKIGKVNAFAWVFAGCFVWHVQSSNV